jgi:ribosome-associated protein
VGALKRSAFLRCPPILVRGEVMRDVLVHSVPVELFKILKFEGLTTSGAEAKAVIAEGQVTLNGVVETQKRKKIVDGDVIEYAGQALRVVTAAP